MASSFFCRGSAESLWKAVVGVSNAGKKRGRGRGAGRRQIKDFNRGQMIGVGRQTLVMPGLNAPILKSNQWLEPSLEGENKQFSENLAKMRNEMNIFKKIRMHPMERGWSGNKAAGKHQGPPDPVAGTPFEDFESTVLMLRPLVMMRGPLGRSKAMNALVVTGNGNGLAGFATSTAKDGRAAIRNARNRAGQALVHVELGDGHTVLHDFFSRYYYTTIFVERKPKGYGIVAHRAIKAICEAFGIKDLHAKCEGSSGNVINITKAFFLGLMNQRPYQEIADEKKLHLVEVSQQTSYFPRVLASPADGARKESDISTDEILDFNYYIYNGRIRQQQRKVTPSYVGTPAWQVHLDKMDYVKNRDKSQISFAAKYDDRSVFDVFPGYKTNAIKRKNSEEEVV